MARINRILAMLAISTVLATCGPSEPPPPTSPSPPLTVTGVRIEGPASIAPGASASYHLIATRSDGTTADVTSQSEWSSSNGSVLAVQSPGGVRGERPGEAVLFARNNSLQPTQFQTRDMHVLVLEDGTFRLTGHVQESGARLAGARVEVVSGTGTGLTSKTDSSGSYVLYGVAGDIRIDATLDGFERESRTLRVNENTSADITMRPTVPPTDLNGRWTMTLMASAECVPAFPEEASSRSYTAVVSQTGTALKLDLIAPGVTSSTIDGLVVGRSLTLFLPSEEVSYYPLYGRTYSLVEKLASGQFLAIAGTARGQSDGNAVTGRLSGDFVIYASGPGRNNALIRSQVGCHRDDHEFRLDRN